MQNTQNFTVSLEMSEAEKLRGSLFKPETAIIVEKIQKQILDALEREKSDPDLFNNNK